MEHNGHDSSDHVHLHHRPEPSPARGPKPWTAPDPLDDIEHSRQQRTSALSRDLLALDDVIKTGNAPGPSLPTPLLDIDKVLRPHAKYLEILKDGQLSDGKRKRKFICLICAIQPPGSRAIPKSKKRTKKREDPFFDDKPGLRQHLDRVHLPYLVTSYFTFLPRPCRRVFGVETECKKHELNCAEECKSLDKPSHKALVQLRADLIKCWEMEPYNLAKQQLPVLFDEVNGEAVKRYDDNDKTNHLMLRPRKTTDTNPCADPDSLHALKVILRAVLDGYMGQQKAQEVWDEVMLENTSTDPAPPSVQTQTCDTAEQLSIVNQGKAPGPKHATHKAQRSRTMLGSIKDVAVNLSPFSQPDARGRTAELVGPPRDLSDYSFGSQETLTSDSQPTNDSESVDWPSRTGYFDHSCIDPRLLEVPAGSQFSSQNAQFEHFQTSDAGGDTAMEGSPWSPGPQRQK